MITISRENLLYNEEDGTTRMHKVCANNYYLKRQNMNQTNEFPTFPAECKSLLCKHLTKEVFEALKDKKTANGFTLQDAIHSGVLNPDSGIGVYAGDLESYTLFAKLFDPIIQEYHGFSPDDKHKSNFNPDMLNAPNPDPKGEYIVSTRIRVGRNVANLPLGPAITKEQRDQIEESVSQSLQAMQENLKGDYYPLTGMNDDTKATLISDHFLFKTGDRFLEAAGLNRNWPEGRGIYHNDEKTFLVWINEEDQLRVISMQMGGDILEVFTRLSTAIKEIEKKVAFSYSEHLGYITSCPTNLGTAMRASVHIKLPKLAQDMEAFKAITDKHFLQIRGIHGEHSESEGGIYDISNKRRLGVTEVECVQDMVDGVKELIAKEKSL
jgi:creatine kinase/arginine kinase